MFDWENEIALDTMQGNQVSSRGEGKDSCVFSSCGNNLAYILELEWGCPLETGVCFVKSGHLSRYDGHLGKLNKLGRTIRRLLEVRRQATPY